MKRAKQAGFSLAEVMIASMIGAVLSLAVAGVMAWTAQNQARSMELIKLEEFKQQLLANLSNDKAWLSTIQLNAAAGNSMKCLTKNQACVDPATTQPWTNQPFALYDLNGGLIFDAINPKNGLTPRGDLCNSFAATGNDDCPLRYDLKWSAVCSGAGCVNPQVLVNARLVYSPAQNGQHRLVIDTDRYSIVNFYPSPSPCFAKTKVYGQPGNNLFTVPAQFQNLVVEEWGAGGGGAAVIWNCSQSPGQNGGDSSFGGLVAPGGPGGSGAGSSVYWAYGCVNGGCGFVVFPFSFCGGPDPWVGFPPIADPWCAPNSVCRGGDGEPGVPISIPPNQSLCTSNVGNLNGRGGRGGQNYSESGSSAGGGGAGSPMSVNALPIPPCGCACNNFCVLIYWGVVGMGGGAMSGGSWIAGNYKTRTYTPATLPPGSSIPVVVGQGGQGGNMGAPYIGGNGANGFVKITWW